MIVSNINNISNKFRNLQRVGLRIQKLHHIYAYSTFMAEKRMYNFSNTKGDNINTTKKSQINDNQIDNLENFKYMNGCISKKTKKARVQIQYEDNTQKNSISSENKQSQKHKNEEHVKKKDNEDTEKSKNSNYDCRGNHEEVYEIIKKYRDSHHAPVDTLGCHNQGGKDLPENEQNFQKLLAVILSVQTKDEITDMVMKNVVKHKITISKAAEMNNSELKEIISQVNFNSKKAEYIQNVAQVIKSQYNSRVPDSYDDLVKIKGIGPKIANIFLQCAYNKTVGIAVDTHVHRISNRLGWVETKNPEQTRIELQKLLEKKYWKEINVLLVGFGQILCKPINPQCHLCPLNDKCPESSIKTPILKKSKNNSKIN